MLTFYSLFIYKYCLNFLNYLRFLSPSFLYNINLLNNFSIWSIKNYDIFLNLKILNFLQFCEVLKKHHNFLFSCLVEISCVDLPSKIKRYSLNYFFLSLFYNFRIIIQLNIKEWTNISSLVSLYSSSNWLEREVWDMFGVFFSGNYDLRRILTDYGFKYFPLRKDFPLSGFLEVRYDDFLKSLIYEPVEFAQEYRRFEFKNFWYL